VAERDRLQLGQPVAAAGAAGTDRSLVADQLAAAAGEDRRAFNKACTLLLAAACGEPPDAAALREHAAKDRDAAVAGVIGRVQSGADFDNDAGAQEEVSAEPFGKRAAPGVACQSDAKPAPPGAAGNTVDQYRLNPLQREIVRPIQRLESESQNGNSRSNPRWHYPSTR
jgi:hypothetical protein